jgi:hypothetical protein
MKLLSFYASRALAHLIMPATSIMMLCLAVNGAFAESYETFDPQGSINTIPTGIDSKGRICGYWDDAQSIRHGFVRAANGKITTFDAPGAVNTSVSGIDSKGNITGDFFDGTHQHGYLRNAAGDITVFDAKGDDTHSNAIDAHGGTVGFYGFDGQNQLHGFLRTRSGKIKTIDSTDALEVIPTAVIANGTVAGWIFNGGGTGPAISAFIRYPDKTLDVFSIEPNEDAQIVAMNADGTTTGYYMKNSNNRGFVRLADGTVAGFDPKDSENTIPKAIGPDGTVVGFYQKPDGAVHAFIRTPDGKIASFDVKDAIETYAQAINASGAIAGHWLDTSGLAHSFIRTP